MSSSSFCSCRFTAVIFLVISAVPVAYIVSLERAVPSTHVFSYHSSGFLRECAKWDDVGRRFLVSYMDGGGIGEVVPRDSDDGDDNSEDVMEEVTLVKDVNLGGNASAGIVIDRDRNRLLVAVGDLVGNHYSALAAYDLSTWRRIFLTELSVRHSKEITFADDVTFDTEGNAYVTDARGNKIWKVDVNGKLVYTLKSPLFTPPGWFDNIVSLNGIVYHPDGFLIVIHTISGLLYKIDLADGDIGNDKVSVIKVTNGTLRFGDGLEILSPTKIVVAGNPYTKLVESSDGWRTASVTGWFGSGMYHRLISAATIKEGRVYLTHVVGFGSKKRHILVEAVF